MVTLPDGTPYLTPEEYFAWEAKQLEKHELIDGQPYARVGGSVNHSRIAIHLLTMLNLHVESERCMVGNSDLRINIVKTHNDVDPDVSVTCDDRDQHTTQYTTQYITYPCLIVEVLPARTEAYDRGQKFRRYRQNPV